MSCSHWRTIDTVSCGLRAASSPTFSIDCWCTWPCTWAMSIILAVWLTIAGGGVSSSGATLGDATPGSAALAAAAFGHRRLGRARDLVIDDFLGLLALVALACVLLAVLCLLLLLLCARQLVADCHLALAIVGLGLFLARLARAQHAPLGIELVERLGYAVEVELGGELHPRAARSDHRGDDRLDLILQALLVGDL